ncbi:MAG: pyridoxamine kinase [Treponemataceae bacterium]
MKRVVTIQDISCVGKCSLTVALPIISALGVETAIIPTAVLSTHTMFKGFTFHDLTAEIIPICEHWKKEGFKFDAIYTGYLGSFEQINLMKKLFADFKGENTLCIVDPCMADNGALYTGFTQEFAFEMANLVGIADVTMPNITEASYLLGIPYKKPGEYDETYIKNILLDLSKLGAKQVVLKGVEFHSDQDNFKNVKGKIGIVSYDSKTKTFSNYFHEKQAKSFHGTGDIFASVCVGCLMQNASLQQAYSIAADFVEATIKETVSHPKHNTYGVDFEAVFPQLLKRLAEIKIK